MSPRRENSTCEFTRIEQAIDVLQLETLDIGVEAVHDTNPRKFRMAKITTVFQPILSIAFGVIWTTANNDSQLTKDAKACTLDQIWIPFSSAGNNQ
ncbi:hypothetical protein KL918_003292 [Ogataea parapolymorpha]|uniref:Uncharacterized protein n=1 Tax=Ogataea parapolymorpha (strain ATCC 26012 / BCRC 20466 / JCM 22074 / NRRL Y-7560 / DL-1) TaxID=871575 RepID=W1QBZ1_OGAPD|nr:hypothetical protein HPODL_01985 [Ogataea parapolymorpha DL-1]ESW97909.1 hypothetical protein HPODL_01985 [Ogataea parapolymorpha DL-1]KAG7867097.1 hypothetical protein KL918_003292 [Ogataea parapolymorpha]KAG7872461.1 hypothetical protein KL916_003196 [Ogataea parapolymorpha]